MADLLRPGWDHPIKGMALAPNARSLCPSHMLRRRGHGQKARESIGGVDRAARPPPSTDQEAAVRDRDNRIWGAHMYTRHMKGCTRCRHALVHSGTPGFRITHVLCTSAPCATLGQMGERVHHAERPEALPGPAPILLCAHWLQRRGSHPQACDLGCWEVRPPLGPRAR